MSGAKRRPLPHCAAAWAAVVLGCTFGTLPPAAGSEPHGAELAAGAGAGGPFLLTFRRPGRYMEITGVAEALDGTLWVTGYAQDSQRGIGAGYLAAIGRDGSIRAEHEILLPDAAMTQFWWPAPLADGRVAVAAALDPFTERPNGAVAIIAADGTLADRVLLTELGITSGDLVHVETYPDGDLAIAGSARVGPTVNGAMTARLGPDLGVDWMVTQPARDPDYTLAAYASVVLFDGSVAAIGTATSSGFADGYGWLARYDASGNELWRQWLTGGLVDLMEEVVQIYGNWVGQAPEGDIIYLQTGYDDSGQPVANTLIRRSLSGQILNQLPLAFTEHVDLVTLDVTRNGDVIVAGDAGPDQMPLIARVAPDGALIWTRKLEMLTGGFVWGVTEAMDGGIVAVGTYFPAEHGTGAGWVVRLAGDGTLP